MKVLAVFVSIVISTLTTTAFAGLPGDDIIVEPIFERAANLDKINIDPDFQDMYLPMAVDQASITVSEIPQTVTLTLIMNACPPNAYCFVGPTVRNITLPIVKNKSDKCGVQTIIAKKDQLPVDGDLKEIKVVDNTLSKCDEKRFFTKVVLKTASYDRKEVKLYKTRSTFSGNGLGQTM